MDPLKNGDIFRIKNTAYLKSPVPHHILSKRRQSSDLQRPIPSYPPMNPTLPIATIKSSTTFSFRNDFKSPQNFKVPDLPASHRKIPHSNIGLPAATPAQKSIEPMHSTASNSKAQQEVTPIASRNSLLISSLSSQIDESIHELVDSIHKTVEEESLRIEKTCSDASDEEKEECSKTDILPEELLKVADTDKEPEEEEEDTPPPPPPPIKRGRGRPRKSEQSKAPSSSVSTATKLVKSTEKKKKTKADERKSHESLLKKIEAESGKKASRFDSWWLKSVPNPKPGIVPVVIEGFLKAGSDVTKMWHSSFIAQVISPRIFKTHSGSLYALDGDINQATMEVNGYSKSITSAFAQGFPENWKELLIVKTEQVEPKEEKEEEEEQKEEEKEEPQVKQKKESKREIKREKETIIVVDVEQESPVKTSSPPPSKRPRKTTNEAPKRKRTYRKSDSLLIVMDNEGIINDLADAESRPVKMTRSRSIGKETLKFEWGTGRVKILPDGAKRNRTKKSVESPKPEQQKSPVSTKAKGKSIEKDSDSDEPSESTWSLSEDKLLEQALWSKNPRSSNYWEQVASCVPERTAKECRHRYHSNFGREENSSCNRPQID